MTEAHRPLLQAPAPAKPPATMEQYLELFDPGLPVGAQWVEVDQFADFFNWMPGQTTELKALVLYRYQNSAGFPWGKGVRYV